MQCGKPQHSHKYFGKEEGFIGRPRRNQEDADSPRKMRPALTPQSRESQLVSLAVDLAEKQMREGTASSQVITHFLKLATEQAKLEIEILKKQQELISAKTESLKSAKHMEELYTEALSAFRKYNGQDDDDTDIQ